MTRKVLGVILRLNPEQLVHKHWDEWCKVIKHGHYCFRKQGHTGPHVTGMGCSMKQDDVIETPIPLYDIQVWEQE